MQLVHPRYRVRVMVRVRVKVRVKVIAASTPKEYGTAHSPTLETLNAGSNKATTPCDTTGSCRKQNQKLLVTSSKRWATDQY